MSQLDPAAVRLLDENTETRRDAVEAVDTSVLAGRYVLRQALLTDEDAEVRASAARRLGEARDERFAPALLEALSDPMSSVRDRAWRALARLGSRELLPHAPPGSWGRGLRIRGFARARPGCSSRREGGRNWARCCACRWTPLPWCEPRRPRRWRSARRSRSACPGC